MESRCKGRVQALVPKWSFLIRMRTGDVLSTPCSEASERQRSWSGFLRIMQLPVGFESGFPRRNATNRSPGVGQSWVKAIRMITNVRHQLVLGLKQVLYGRRGEPYRIEGHTLRYLPGTRPVRLRYIRSRNGNARYDALQVVWLSNHLAEGDTAVDIGAHYGTYTILMAAMCGQTGHVVAFEPDPYARAVLSRNLSLNPRINRPTVEVCACSDKIGEATLFSRGGNSQSSLTRSAVEFSPEHQSEEIRVPLVTLDSYLSERNLPEPHCVKIDAEGAEIRILKGAKQILSSNANIVCELHPYAWREFGNTLAELKDLAAAAGRRIRYLDQDTEIGEQAEYGIVLLER
jgi:FkbM family methyltransferase